MRYVKILLAVVFVGILIVMGGATFMEHAKGTDFVSQEVYSSWWFFLLWFLLAAFSIVWIAYKRLWNRAVVMAIHLSFLFILVGASVTFFTSEEGSIHLRKGKKENTFLTNKGEFRQLPFSLKLQGFEVAYYPGTHSPSDYHSRFIVEDKDGNSVQAEVSMNNIYIYKRYRFYQISYDEDNKGTGLLVRYDPFGTPVTYCGYGLLLLSMVAMLFNRKEHFRILLKKMSSGTVLLLMVLLFPMRAEGRSLPTINKQKAEEVARKQIVYNDRVVPFNTMAQEFLKKIYGKTSYHRLSAEQVVVGWMNRPDVWKDENMILIKSAKVRDALGEKGKYVSFSDFFDSAGNYRLPVLQEKYGGKRSKEWQEVDEKVGLMVLLVQGGLFEPVSKGEQRLSETHITAEILYNKIPVVDILFMFNLLLGIIVMVLFVWREDIPPLIMGTIKGLYAVSLVTICAYYVLRWYVSGRVPLANGYETMLFMACMIMLVSWILSCKERLMLSFGFLMSGFTLLVAHITDMNPQITHLMPVLNSPLLSIHVSVIMMSYTLFTLMFVISVAYFVIRVASRKERKICDRLSLLNNIILYPAVFLLAIGVFLGAVWANVSWGKYWGWDPKEVWALITLMVYSVLFHKQTLPSLKKPVLFHIYIMAAFLVVLMTYFGVNYFLGGMHSYS